MSDLVLYTNPMSRGRIARWMLEETQRPYRAEIVEYPKMADKGFRAVNPMGKVPTLTHGDITVTEAAAICTYLADITPEAKLMPPPGAHERGEFYRWMFFGAGPVEAAVTNAAFKFEVPPEREAATGYGSLDRVLDTLEQLLSDKRAYLLGERFSAVDVYLGSQIGWGLTFGTMDPRPGFQDYWDRMADRPAAKRAREIDDALMPKDQQRG